MPTLVIALFTAKDLLRRRILVVLALFGVGMILLSFPLRELTIGQWQRLITDVGLGATELSLTLVAVFVGSSLIAGDLERRTLYPPLSKPISRGSFVLGKFLGLSLVLLGLVGLMGGGTEFMLLAAHQQNGIAVNGAAITGIWLSVTLIGAMAILFSSFTTSTLAATFTLSLTLLGHFVDNLAYFASKSGSGFGKLVSALVRVLPNFELINLKDFAAHQQAISGADFLHRLVYASCYCVLVVALAAIIFTRRDLK